MSLNSFALASNLLYCYDVAVRQSDGSVFSACATTQKQNRLVVIAKNLTLYQPTLANWVVLGNPYADQVRGIDIDQRNQDIYVAGITYGGTSKYPNQGGADITLSRIHGNNLTLAQMIITGTDKEDYAFGISVSDTSVVTVVGSTQGVWPGLKQDGNSDNDAVVLSYDRNRTLIWRQVIGTSSSEFAICVLSSGQSTFVGGQWEEAYGFVTSFGASNGSQLWTYVLPATTKSMITSLKIIDGFLIASGSYTDQQVSQKYLSTLTVRLSTHVGYQLSDFEILYFGDLQGNQSIQLFDTFYDSITRRIAFIGLVYDQVVEMPTVLLNPEEVIKNNNKGLYQTGKMITSLDYQPYVIYMPEAVLFAAHIDTMRNLWTVGAFQDKDGAVRAYIGFDDSTFKLPLQSSASFSSVISSPKSSTTIKTTSSSSFSVVTSTNSKSLQTTKSSRTTRSTILRSGASYKSSTKKQTLSSTFRSSSTTAASSVTRTRIQTKSLSSASNGNSLASVQLLQTQTSCLYVGELDCSTQYSFQSVGSTAYISIIQLSNNYQLSSSVSLNDLHQTSGTPLQFTFVPLSNVQTMKLVTSQPINMFQAVLGFQFNSVLFYVILAGIAGLVSLIVGVAIFLWLRRRNKAASQLANQSRANLIEGFDSSPTDMLNRTLLLGNDNDTMQMTQVTY